MTLFLDAVGTLFGLREPPGHLYARVAQRHGIQVDSADLARHFGPIWKGADPPDYGVASGAAAREAIDQAWWRSVVLDTFRVSKATSLDSSFEACFEEIFALYGTAAPWQVYPDTSAALSRLRQRGHRLIVLSNFDQRLEAVMEALGLSDHVDQILYSSSLGACKPSPEAFSRALARSESEPETTLHIGDDLDTDGRGAAAAGLQFFHLRRPEVDLWNLESHLHSDGKK